MLAVVLLAVKWGRGPAIVAAFLNVALFDFFFVPPRFSFMVSDIQYLLTFGVMLAAGIFIGQLAGRLRFQARVAAHREKRARMLYEFARDLAQLRTTSQVIETTEEFMSRQFRSRVAVLVPDTTGTLVSPTGRGMTNPFDSTPAQWAFDQAQSAGAGTETLAGNEYLFLPLKSPTRTGGVLAGRPQRARALFIPQQRRQAHARGHASRDRGARRGRGARGELRGRRPGAAERARGRGLRLVRARREAGHAARGGPRSGDQPGHRRGARREYPGAAAGVGEGRADRDPVAVTALTKAVAGSGEARVAFLSTRRPLLQEHC